MRLVPGGGSEQTPLVLSGVQLITSGGLSVTDSWVKWLWQHTEPQRIHFQTALEPLPASICQPKNRNTDYQSQLTLGNPRKRPVCVWGGGHSNINKHEDQQMALCQSPFLVTWYSFLSFISVWSSRLLIRWPVDKAADIRNKLKWML